MLHETPRLLDLDRFVGNRSTRTFICTLSSAETRFLLNGLFDTLAFVIVQIWDSGPVRDLITLRGKKGSHVGGLVDTDPWEPQE